MPPLERPSSTDHQLHFLSMIDNQLLSGKDSGEGGVSRIDLREVAVHAHRDLVFISNPLAADATATRQQYGGKASNDASVDWVDLFTSLCTCQASPLAVFERPRKRAAVGATKNIMYPVARYPDRLNSPHLVERRRKSIEKHLTFRPVME